MTQETKSLVNLVSNLAFSIAIPIYILNSTKLPFTPEVRLIVAILFPLIYGAFDWWQTKKHNVLAILGLVNVTITGGFGLMQLSGIWFSIKEAVFPLLIGIFVWISGLRKTPFLNKMLMSPDVFNVSHLEQTLQTKNKQIEFDSLVLRCNHLLAGSFFVSALLNFIIAQQTFLPIDLSLSTTAQADVLNHQIALMHKRGFLGIAIPSMVMMLGLLYYYFKQLEKITGESIESFFNQASDSSKKTIPKT